MATTTKKKTRYRKYIKLTPQEHEAIKSIIDNLEFKYDAKKLLRVATYNTIDKVYNHGRAGGKVVMRIRSLIANNNNRDSKNQ